MAHAAELVLAATTVVGEDPHDAALDPGDVVAVAALGARAELLHDGPPLGPMGTDPRAVTQERSEVRHLVGNRLGDKGAWILQQQDRIVADDQGALATVAGLPRGPTP